MSDHEFTIPVSELDAGGKDFRFPIRAGWVRGALEGHEATSTGSDGELAVRASKSGHDVVVHGTLDTEVTVPCARCLEPAKLAIHSDLSVLYVPKSSLASGKPGEELPDQEANTFPFEGETVVLDDLVRDELLLEIPMIPLCSEACPGMSPPLNPSETLKEKPIDPRLAPLLELAQKAKGGSGQPQ
jgi:uncharacterized protein